MGDLKQPAGRAGGRPERAATGETAFHAGIGVEPKQKAGDRRSNSGLKVVETSR